MRILIAGRMILIGVYSTVQNGVLTYDPLEEMIKEENGDKKPRGLMLVTGHMCFGNRI